MSMKDVKAGLQKLQSRMQENWQAADAIQRKAEASTVELELALLQKACVNEAMLALVPVQAAVSMNFMEREQVRWHSMLRKGATL